MKVVIFSGSHPRHLFVHQEVVASGADCLAIVMQREEVLPKPPDGIPQRDRTNFIRHFRDRKAVELAHYGALTPSDIFGHAVYTSPQSINSREIADSVREFDADLAFIFGTDIIRSPVLDVLPTWRINMHLGLSPWYKGAATLFWPFYFLSPQMAGTTFHRITPSPDSGDIVHQSLPELSKGDGIHDVAAKTVIQAKRDIARLLGAYASNRTFTAHPQKTLGRLFLNSDFRPAHLRVIYDLYENKLVDQYLAGSLGGQAPRLVTAW
jgi:methionyl-tRNA formyltransferase